MELVYKILKHNANVQDFKTSIEIYNSIFRNTNTFTRPGELPKFEPLQPIVWDLGAI